MIRGVDQLSRGTLAWLRVPMVSTICPSIRPGSLVPWGQPCVPGNSHSSLRARGVVQLSRASWARVQWSRGSTSFPRPLRPVSEGPRFRPALPGESRSALRPTGLIAVLGVTGQSPMACGIDQMSRATRACVRGPTVSTINPGLSCPCPRASWVDQLSCATRGRVWGPAGSTSFPRRLRSGSECPWSTSCPG